MLSSHLDVTFESLLGVAGTSNTLADAIVHEDSVSF